jgi:FkbM family methyltransferase
MLQCGAQVVAVEPNPRLARLLKRLYPNIDVSQAAMSDKTGTAELHISHLSPSVASISQQWIDSVSQQPAFSRVKWEGTIEVTTTTLDALIDQFGHPSFCKIDVEGSELAVLQGLTRSIRTISFEMLPEAIEEAAQCVRQITGLDSYEFNIAHGEGAQLQFHGWITAEEVISAANRSSHPSEIYARLANPQ